MTQRDEKKKINSIIFPRYHQLDATRKLQAKVLEEGAGGKFLIQHSAGSGKTNSIAWSAHFLADLHDSKNEKLFSTVIVISDRNVIDAQLQDALFDFQRTTGVVATIKSEGASKSGQLAEALGAGKKIIVCTIQTFPFALEEVRKLAATEGKRFAVIGRIPRRPVRPPRSSSRCCPRRLAELEMAASQHRRHADGPNGGPRQPKGITYAHRHPEAKTLQLFGRLPKPDQPVGDSNLPAPFHVYSMRQAIEEGFISTCYGTTRLTGWPSGSPTMARMG